MGVVLVIGVFVCWLMFGSRQVEATTNFNVYLSMILNDAFTQSPLTPVSTATGGGTVVPTSSPTVTVTPTQTATPSPTLSPTRTPTRTVVPTATSTATAAIAFLSIEAMNQTKDKVCNQPSDAEILFTFEKIKALGATYVTIATPYDWKTCGGSQAYVQRLVNIARAVGLQIWWRQMFSEFEGIEVAVVPQCNALITENCNDYVAMMSERIEAQDNLGWYEDGDRFSITAEPGAGRIKGVTCFSDTCVFQSETGGVRATLEFNRFLVDSVTKARETFADLSLDVTVDGGGLDGYIVTGFDNPDWSCEKLARNDLYVLYSSTVKVLGTLVVDHYFDSSKYRMSDFMAEIDACYPESEFGNLKVVFGEWGPIRFKDGDGNIIPGQVEPTVLIQEVFDDICAAGERFWGGLNYWQVGPSDPAESLLVNISTGLGLTDNYHALKAAFAGGCAP